MLDTQNFDDLYNHAADFSFIEPPEESDTDPPSDDLWFSIAHDSADQNFDAAVQFLMNEHEFPGNRRLVKKCLKCILVNIGRLLRSERSSLLYRRSHGYYTKMRKDRLKNPLCITKAIIPVIDVLIRECYLEGATGYSSHYWDSKCSSIRPLAGMKAVFAKYDLSAAKSRKSEYAPLVVVKNAKKEIIYLRSKEIIQMEERVSMVNDLLNITDIRLEPGTVLPQGICLDDISLFRVFNNSTIQNGGRFYGGFWQQLPSAMRSKIQINGKKTEELDFSGQHISLLYAVLGHQIPDNLRRDPYGCKTDSAFPRKLFKMAALTAINSDSPKKAWQSMKNDLRPKKKVKESQEALNEKAWLRTLIRTQKEFDVLIEEFLTVHPLLREGLYKGWGVRLMRMDSDIADDILCAMAKKGIAVLPVHDSFIVEKQHTEELLAAMRAAYLESQNPALLRAFTSIKDREKIIYDFTPAMALS